MLFLLKVYLHCFISTKNYFFMPQAGHLLKGQKGWYCEDEQEMRKQQKYSWLNIEHLAIFEFELIDVLM